MRTRRRNHSGSVYQRVDGRWVASVMVEGVRKSRYYKTEEAAREALPGLVAGRLHARQVSHFRLPLRVKLKVWRRDNFTCQYCGDDDEDMDLTIDHVVPLSKGGTNELSNLVTACKPCNTSKGNKAWPTLLFGKPIGWSPPEERADG